MDKKLLNAYVQIKSHFEKDWRPHLVPESVDFLESVISKDSNVLELGAGSSTNWFAERTRKVISLEHSYSYYILVKYLIEFQGLTNVDLRLTDYLSGINKITGKFDIILIDGRHRVACIKAVFGRLMEGGYLILDDSQRPKYREAIEFLDAKGWERRDFKIDEMNPFGFIPITTIWRKPQ